MSTVERQLAYIWGGLALAVVALAPLWSLLVSFARPCIFHSVTGIPCPTCGATRSVLALLDGRAIESLTFNPLVFASSLVFFAGGVIAPLWAWRRGTLPRLGHPLPMWLRIGIVLVILANWAWLIATLP